jgi:hypothetical protein
MENKNSSFFDKTIFKEWYFKKGLILIDIFLIIALIQYFIFDGSFDDMILWVKGFFQYYF